MAILSTASFLAPSPLRAGPLSGFTGDSVPASEPSSGSSIVPGIPDSSLADLGFELVGELFGGADLTKKADAKKRAAFGDPLAFDEGGGGDCPGLGSVRGPDGICINLGDLMPGGDPALTGQQNGGNGARTFGAPVNGRFGVGVLPAFDVQTVRRCPKGMALGKDGVCYDGLGRNSPKREWPMGMKPLLTPGERNAIRIAGRAAGKLSRSQKSLKKTAKALEKAC